MASTRLLLTAVFGPYGVKDRYGEDLGCQMELLNNQITREQGVHSPRQSYWSFGLYLMAENVSVDTTILDFPSWRNFTRELKRGGYTHVGISFIVPNVLKARRMAEYIRRHYPEIKIILGGYGTIIPDLASIVPHDEVCRGEGVRWLREYFGEDPEAPVRHPALIGPAYEYIYGFRTRPKGAILMPGLGCENACAFCITSHKFEKRRVSLLRSGREVFEACRRTEKERRATGFSVMDENFLKQPQLARELLAEMEEHGKPYVFDLFSSAETIRAVGVDFLVRLGVRMVWIGVESRANTHAKTQGIDLAALIDELQSKGIIVQASMILFQDHHDEKTIDEDIDWVIGLKSSLVQFMNYTPYPTTALHKQYAAEGRLNDVHYRHQHGQGMLNFNHPNFPDAAAHAGITREAFRRKYLADGPGVLNMAVTLAQGYRRAKEDYAQRQREGLVWDAETLRYVHPTGFGVGGWGFGEPRDSTLQDPKTQTPNSKPDTFMKRRLFMMRYVASALRPVLWPAYVFAPNRAARQKARDAMRLYAGLFGQPKAADRLRGLALVATGAIEQARIWLNRFFGRESIVRQPPMRKTEYRHHRRAVSPERAESEFVRLAQPRENDAATM